MKELETIGKNISRIRKAKKLTQEDLCGLAEIDRSYLSELENGKMNVTIGSLIKIAKALDANVRDFL
jgi:transcriptional regulator with XRE-family HTH domain